MVWNWYKDEWLVTRQAAKLFLISTFLVLALTPVILGKIDTTTVPSCSYPDDLCLWHRLTLPTGHGACKRRTARPRWREGQASLSLALGRHWRCRLLKTRGHV